MDIDKIVADNVGLVYKQMHKLNRAYDEDAFSVGFEALAIAASTYDANKDIRFSTYASVCIYNAICRYLRQFTKKRRLEVVLYDDPIPGAGDLTLFETLGSGASPAEEYLDKELYAKLWEAFDKVLGTLPTDIEKSIISSWRESEFTKTQTTLAKEVGVSQAHVSRTLSAFKHKIKLELEDYLC